MRGSVFTRATIIAMICYIAIAVFAPQAVFNQISGQASTPGNTLTSAIGVSISPEGNVIVTPQNYLDLNIININSAETTFNLLAPIQAVWNGLNVLFKIATAPVALMFVDQIPLAIRLFILLPINILTFVGIIQFVRGASL